MACKHAIDDRHGLTIALETLAWIAARLGRPERAACLLGAAERARTESSLALMDLYRPQHEESESAACRQLGRTAYEAAVARGRAMTIGEGAAFAMDDRQARRPVPPVKAFPDTGLTRRQLEIAWLIADDLTNRQIAARLFLSERTVETHVTNMLNKLGLGSRVHLSRWLAEGADPRG